MIEDKIELYLTEDSSKLEMIKSHSLYLKDLADALVYNIEEVLVEHFKEEADNYFEDLEDRSEIAKVLNLALKNLNINNLVKRILTEL